MANPRIKIQINHAALRQIERSNAVKAEQERRATKIVNAAGADTHEMSSFVGKNRVRTTVRTKTPVGAAGRANLKRAIDAGR